MATLAVGNAPAQSARLALKELAVQLRDEHGNAARCETGEAQVRFESVLSRLSTRF